MAVRGGMEEPADFCGQLKRMVGKSSVCFIFIVALILILVPMNVAVISYSPFS